jgi:hypothetical protein
MFAAGAAAMVVGPLVLAFVGLRVGWRPLLIATGLPTLIAAALCLAAWPSDPPRKPFRGLSTAALASAGMLSMGLLLAAPIFYFAMTWLPVYLQRRFHHPLSAMSLVDGATIASGACGTLLAGIIAWASMNAGARAWKARAVLLTVFGCILPLAALSGLSNQRVVVIALAALSMAAYEGWATVLYCAVADTLPARGAAVAASIGALMTALGGMFSPLAIGRIAETDSYGTLFLFVGAAAVIGVVGVVLLAWVVRQEPID